MWGSFEVYQIREGIINVTYQIIRSQSCRWRCVLQGVQLSIGKGEVHAIMGLNGSGKSTPSNVLMGSPDYEVTSGSVPFQGRSLLDMTPDERSHVGVFMAFQYPVSIPGVSVLSFYRPSSTRKKAGKTLLDAYDLMSRVQMLVKRWADISF